VATGDFIAFCDSDDVWERDKLSTQVALLQDNRGFDVAYCDTIIIDVNGVPTGKRFSELFPLPKNPSGWLFLELVKRNFINIQSVLMRRQCVSEEGLFDERIEWIQDWWCWLRLSRKHRFLYSSRPLARYRMHGDSTNLRHKRSYSLNRFRAFRRMLREYSELPRAAKANIIFRMGVDLCDLGRYRHGQRLLWDAIGLSMTDMRAFDSLCKAARRLVLYATARRPRKGTVTRG
jgi:glycosyltransferase involved in cell wall biosynthesis